MKGSEVISKEQLISMIHFLEERDEASKKLDEQLKEEKKSHHTSDIIHLTSRSTSDLRHLPSESSTFIPLPSDILHLTSEFSRLLTLDPRQKIIENYKFTKQNTMINVGIIGCGFVGGAGSIGSNIQQTK